MRRFPRAGRTPRGREGASSQSGIGRAPHCGRGKSPLAGSRCVPAGRRSPRAGRRSPRGGRRSPRGLSTSLCGGWFPPGAKRPFPEGVRPFYGCNGGGDRDLGRPDSPTLSESLASGLHHRGRDDVIMACYVTAGTRVNESAPTRRREGSGVPCGLFSPSQTLGPAPAPGAPWTHPPSPRASLRRRKGGGPGVGGASRSHARLCPPPRPTLPRDRKAEPRLPGPPPPLLAAAVWGWWRLSFFAWDGRGCRYGDRSVALGAAGLREQTYPGPRHLLLLPARTLPASRSAGLEFRLGGAGLL